MLKSETKLHNRAGEVIQVEFKQGEIISGDEDQHVQYRMKTYIKIFLNLRAYIYFN